MQAPVSLISPPSLVFKSRMFVDVRSLSQQLKAPNLMQQYDLTQMFACPPEKTAM